MLTFKDNYFGERNDDNMISAAEMVRGCFPKNISVYNRTLMDIFCQQGTTIEEAAEICRSFLNEMGFGYQEILSADDFKAFTELEFIEIIALEDEGPDWGTRCEDRYGYNCY